MGKKIVLLPLNQQAPSKKGKHVENSGSLFIVVGGKELIKEADKMVWGLIVKGTKESANSTRLPPEFKELLN